MDRQTHGMSIFISFRTRERGSGDSSVRVCGATSSVPACDKEVVESHKLELVHQCRPAHDRGGRRTLKWVGELWDRGGIYMEVVEQGVDVCVYSFSYMAVYWITL